MEIGSGARSLRELLQKQKRLTIPTFQRGYEWEKDNVEAFWTSVVGVAEKRESTFFGPVVTLGGDEIQVVDGQQRITTVFLILSLLRDWVWEQSDQRLHVGSPYEVNLLAELQREIFFTDQNGIPDRRKLRSK